MEHHRILDIELCRQRFEALAERMCRNPESPFGMSGAALFAWDTTGNRVQVLRGTDVTGTPLSMERTACLASLGKVAIALLVLRLIDRGALSLDDTLAAASRMRMGSVGDAVLRTVLSHRAGIPSVLTDEQVPYGSWLSADFIRATCRALDRQSYEPPGDWAVRYSDIAYALLADVVEARYGQELHGCLAELNAALGTRLTIGKPPSSDYITIAGVPTIHTGSDIEPMNSSFWHLLALPWAAICGAPDDGMRLMEALAPHSSFLNASLRASATQDPDAGVLNGGIAASPGQLGMGASAALHWEPCPWGLGVELRGQKWPHWAPREASETSFGHVGISGALAWHDPSCGLSWGVTGTRSSHSGWLLRHGPALGKAVLDSSRAQET